MKWTPILDAQIMLLRCDRIHPAEIAEHLSLETYQVAERLTYLKKVLGYPKYPRFDRTDIPLAITSELIAGWRQWINTGRSRRERVDIMWEIARIHKIDYHTVYKHCHK